MNDRAALQSWIGALSAVKVLQEQPEAILPIQIAIRAAVHPDRLALQGERDTLTYGDFVARINGYANWATRLGLQHGEVVCLLMANCIEYPAIWLGLAQVGCVTALINTSLKSQGLLHCISISGAAHIIVSAEFAESVAAIQALLPKEVHIWLYGKEGVAQYADFSPLQITDNRKSELTESKRYRPTQRDNALLIYTSGTTGLPKAALVSHGRLMEWSYWFCGMMGVTEQDRIYNCLPMYHSTGGVIAVCAMLVGGGAVVIRQRFSASRFWDDVVEQQCTIFMYIGELCRYLTAFSHPRERAHQLRLACGNGMQGDVWHTVQQRFAINRIIEFYAATEGNVSLYNCEGRPGAIGRVPKFLAHRFPIELIRHDPASGAPLRDNNGRCFKCEVDEPGEAIGEVHPNHETPARGFEGYTDSEASSRKTLTDVFAEGDRWFRTGDLMRRDAEGYYYFVDRLGDTFRWKGENVSTTEVAAMINLCPGVTQAIVFGVVVPGCEGRAGMAALLVDEEVFSIQTLSKHFSTYLPSFSVPVFCRIASRFEQTGTFKIQKHDMQVESYSSEIGDAIWYWMQHMHCLVPLTGDIREALTRGCMP